MSAPPVHRVIHKQWDKGGVVYSTCSVCDFDAISDGFPDAWRLGCDHERHPDHQRQVVVSSVQGEG